MECERKYMWEQGARDVFDLAEQTTRLHCVGSDG